MNTPIIWAAVAAGLVLTGTAAHAQPGSVSPSEETDVNPQSVSCFSEDVWEEAPSDEYPDPTSSGHVSLGQCATGNKTNDREVSAAVVRTSKTGSSFSIEFNTLDISAHMHGTCSGNKVELFYGARNIEEPAKVVKATLDALNSVDGICDSNGGANTDKLLTAFARAFYVANGKALPDPSFYSKVMAQFQQSGTLHPGG